MARTFYQLDVFTKTPFHGNPLAVFPEAEGLSDRQMQTIAAEMNLSETVFVLPSSRALRQLRIFTPRQELPLAGHPVVGTWNLLARLGVTERMETGLVTVHQEIGVGVLPVDIEFRGGEPFKVTMSQGSFEASDAMMQECDLLKLADALGLPRNELADSEQMPVLTASTGIRALLVPIRSLEALSRIEIDAKLLTEIYRKHLAIGCYAFCLETMEPESSVHARFFAPDDGISEDAATGSAAGSLGGYLVRRGVFGAGAFVLEQGDYMSRPSRISVEVSGRTDGVSSVRVGGGACIVAKGELYID